jgi:hypothetical protein
MTKFIAAQETVKSMASIKSNMQQQMQMGQAAMGEIGPDANSEMEGESLAAFELQSQQFRKAQDDFDDYMERLKDDIDERARNFEYIEYYDASLRDSNAKDLVTAVDTQDELDERRRPLASINPLYAKASILPPAPQVDDSVSEQLSLNIARYAANALEEIERHNEQTEAEVMQPQADVQMEEQQEFTPENGEIPQNEETPEFTEAPITEEPAVMPEANDVIEPTMPPMPPVEEPIEAPAAPNNGMVPPPIPQQPEGGMTPPPVPGQPMADPTQQGNN